MSPGPAQAIPPDRASEDPSLSGERPARDPLAEFCQRRDPKNAMRRVVVVMEGAMVIDGMPSVSVQALPDLFRRVGWTAPENVSQVVRNAARREYGWLQRDPFRAGQYVVTDVGRATVLGG